MLWGHSPSPSTYLFSACDSRIGHFLAGCGCGGVKNIKKQGKKDLQRQQNGDCTPARGDPTARRPPDVWRGGENITNFQAGPNSLAGSAPAPAPGSSSIPVCDRGRAQAQLGTQECPDIQPPLPVWGEETAKNENKNKLVIPKGLLRSAKGSEGRLGAARVFSSPSKWFCGLYS